jgi:hypothetical protein
LIATPILKTRCPSFGATRPVFGREVTATLHAKGFGFHAGDNAVGGGGGDGGGGVAHSGVLSAPAGRFGLCPIIPRIFRKSKNGRDISKSFLRPITAATINTRREAGVETC